MPLSPVPTWNVLRAGIVVGLTDHPQVAQLTPTDRQHIQSRAQNAYEEVFDSLELQAALGLLSADEHAVVNGPVSRILEVMICEVVALAAEIILPEKKLQ